MTKVRWTLPAHEDFLGIVSWIAANNPAAASKVGRRILSAVKRLAERPYRGRPGRAKDTRELVIPSLPYVVVYTVEAGASPMDPQTVGILRVLHGAMQWPPPENDPTK